MRTETKISITGMEPLHADFCRGVFKPIYNFIIFRKVLYNQWLKIDPQ